MAWPDLELIAVAWLNAQLSVRVVTALPADLEAQMPLVRVTRGPGDDDGISDRPLLDVEAFAPDRGAMNGLAEDARQAMHALAGRAVGGALVDTVSTASGPVPVDYGNPAVFRSVASYRLALRQTAAAAA